MRYFIFLLADIDAIDTSSFGGPNMSETSYSTSPCNSGKRQKKTRCKNGVIQLTFDYTVKGLRQRNNVKGMKSTMRGLNGMFSALNG